MFWVAWHSSLKPVNRPARRSTEFLWKEGGVEAEVPEMNPHLENCKAAVCTQWNLSQTGDAFIAACPKVRTGRPGESAPLSCSCCFKSCPLYHLCMLLCPLLLKKLNILDEAYQYLSINHVTMPLWQSYTFKLEFSFLQIRIISLCTHEFIFHPCTYGED